jgi:hypothetical protein
MLTGLARPNDAQVLSEQRILVAEQNRITERDRQGRILWQKAAPGPVNVQRLRNGNTFIACFNQLIEVNRAGQEVLRIAGQGIRAARKLSDGRIVTYELGQLIQRDPKGNLLKSVRLDAGGGGCNEILDNGHALICSPGFGNLIEFNPDGQVVQQFNVSGAAHGYRLPNGHTLLTINGTRYVELNAKWQQVKETPLTPPAFRVKRR